MVKLTTKFDTNEIKQKAEHDLLTCIDSVRGTKSLVLDGTLVASINAIAAFSTLQEHGVDKIFRLDSKPVSETQKTILFICSAIVSNAQAIAEQLQADRKDRRQKNYSVFFVPRVTVSCRKVFEEAGLLGDLALDEFPLYFLPLENDVLSLEYNDAFKDIYLVSRANVSVDEKYRDYSSIFYAAKALMNIQLEYGLFPRIIGKGDQSRTLCKLLLRLREERAVEFSHDPLALAPSTVLDNLIIIERDTDLVTPLLTQLTYEGLIDEFYGIEHGRTNLEPSIIGTGQNSITTKDPIPENAGSSRKRKLPLDSSDKLFHSIRDNNFARVGNVLNKIAHRLNDDYEGRHQAKTVTQLKEFVNKLGGLQTEHQSLRLHTSIAEDIMNKTRTEEFKAVLEVQQTGVDLSSRQRTFEELMARGFDFNQILRLICLDSLVSGGLKRKDLEALESDILQSYGYQHLLTLSSLQKLQLLQTRPSGVRAPSYTQIQKAFHLIVEEHSDEDEPADIAYVYSGFAPLTIRLVQCILQKERMAPLSKKPGASNLKAAAGWKGFEDSLKLVKGRTFDEIQHGEDKTMRARLILNGNSKGKTDVVFFVGGCTFSEISALRLVAQQEDRQIIVATTNIIDGNKMINTARYDQ